MSYVKPWYFSRVGIALLVALVLEGCSVADVGIRNVKWEPPHSSWRVELPIVGYNYTNRTIAYFKVDSVGGGNIHVSSPTSGGGGSTCCAVYIKGAKPWKATIEHQSGACRYNETIQASGKPTFDLHRYFKKVTVDVDPRIPADPKQLEVHFYPDGTIEVALTDERSLPRLSLPHERAEIGSYPLCPNNVKPVAGGIPVREEPQFASR